MLSQKTLRVLGTFFRIAVGDIRSAHLGYKYPRVGILEARIRRICLRTSQTKKPDVSAEGGGGVGGLVGWELKVDRQKGLTRTRTDLPRVTQFRKTSTRFRSICYVGT